MRSQGTVTTMMGNVAAIASIAFLLALVLGSAVMGLLVTLVMLSVVAATKATA